MSILFCTKCGYKDTDFLGDLCPKCNHNVIRNLSTENYCVECNNFILDRNTKDNAYTGAFKCKFLNIHVSIFTPSCNEYFDNRI